MKTRFESFHQPRRKALLPNWSNHRLPAQRRNQRVKKIQLVYAHFGPQVVFSVTEEFGYIPRLPDGHGATGSPGDSRQGALFK